MKLRSRIGPACVSLGLATLLWLVVNNLDRSPATFRVPVTYDHPSDIVKLEGFATEVELRVLGTKPKLRTLSSADFGVKVSNGEGRIGQEIIVLDAENVQAPFGVVVEQVTPSQLTVIYDRRVSREAPVIADLQGQPADGYEVAWNQIVVSPSRARLAGPSRLFNPELLVRTEKIDISGRKANFNTSALSLVAPSLSFSLEGPSQAQVIVPIQPIITKMTFDDIAINVIPGPWRTSAPNPKALKVTIEGPQPVLRLLTPADVSVAVDVRNLEPRTEDYKLEPEVRLRDGACPTCRVTLLSQKRVNVLVRNVRRPTEGTP